MYKELVEENQRLKEENKKLLVLDDYLQLHEELTIWYVVDGYEVRYSVNDSIDRCVAKSKGDTIVEALGKLIEILSTKSLTEWRSCQQ